MRKKVGCKKAGQKAVKEMFNKGIEKLEKDMHPSYTLIFPLCIITWI